MPQFTDGQAKLYQSCVPLARWLARKVSRKSSVPLDDLECDALTTLADAAIWFQADRGPQFAVYATVCIRRRLRRVVRDWGKLRACQLPVDEDGQAIEFPSPRRDRMEAIEAGDLVDTLKRQLPERDFAILWRVCAAGETLRAVGGSIGLSGERVRQMVLGAAEKARGVLA